MYQDQKKFNQYQKEFMGGYRPTMRRLQKDGDGDKCKGIWDGVISYIFNCIDQEEGKSDYDYPAPENSFAIGKATALGAYEMQKALNEISKSDRCGSLNLYLCKKNLGVAHNIFKHNYTSKFHYSSRVLNELAAKIRKILERDGYFNDGKFHDNIEQIREYWPEILEPRLKF